MNEVFNVEWRKRITGNKFVTFCGVYKILENRLYKALGQSKFALESIHKPADAVVAPLNSEQRTRYLSTPSITDFSGLNSALELGKWEKHTRPIHLTIHDIKKMQPGSSIKVLLLDRNLYDVVEGNNKPDTMRRAEEFFNCNTAIYYHEKDMNGKILHCHNNAKKQPFEFHIEYKATCWYPLEDGKLPARDDNEGLIFGPVPQHYKDFPETTRIGWRGPMILWDLVHHQPNVFWTREDNYFL